MHQCTISYGPLRIDWDKNGTLTIARTDLAGSVQLSLSEWEFLLKCAIIRGWPVAPPVQTGTVDSAPFPS